MRLRGRASGVGEIVVREILRESCEIVGEGGWECGREEESFWERVGSVGEIMGESECVFREIVGESEVVGERASWWVR